MTKAEHYVRLRLAGKGSREAAREVGFSGGRPSGHANRLWRDVETLRSKPAACGWVRKSVAELEEQLQVAREKARACDLIRMLEENPPRFSHPLAGGG